MHSRYAMEPLGDFDVIAERELSVESNSAARLLVRLWRPERNDGGCSCRYRIQGAGVDLDRRAYGLDEFQATRLALPIIGIQIEALQKTLGALRWNGDDPGFGTAEPL